MAPKSDRVEARLSPEQRELILRAAGFADVSMSSFIVTAAVEKAEEVIRENMVTRVAPDFFDQLVEALDEPDPAPRLARAAELARQRDRIR